MRNEFTAIIERDGDWFIAYCLEIPGANGQGSTKDSHVVYGPELEPSRLTGRDHLTEARRRTWKIIIELSASLTSRGRNVEAVWLFLVVIEHTKDGPDRAGTSCKTAADSIDHHPSHYTINSR